MVDGENQLNQVFNEYNLLVSQELYLDLDVDPAMLWLMASGATKSGKYDGKLDFSEFSIVGWMQLVGHCGGLMSVIDNGDTVPSAHDRQRKLALHGFLTRSGKHWYSTFIDHGRFPYK